MPCATVGLRRTSDGFPTAAHFGLRKLTKHRGTFPSDDAPMKQIHLALRNFSEKWTTPIRDWNAALNQFTIRLEGRLSQP